MADTCGLGPCFRPTWLRRFSTPRYFLIVYSLLGTVQAMAFVYFVATLTTLEKRFKIPSKTTGKLNKFQKFRSNTNETGVLGMQYLTTIPSAVKNVNAYFRTKCVLIKATSIKSCV